MKNMKLLVAIAMLFYCGSVFSQIYTPVVPTTWGLKVNRIQSLSTSHIPSGGTNTLNGGSVDPGGLFFNTGDNYFYAWNGTTFDKYAKFSDVSGGMTNPMTTLGDIIYMNATPVPARLAGNTTTAKKMLSQTGNGSISASPSWEVLVAGDIPDISATYLTVATAATLYQPLDADLTAISALSGTNTIYYRSASNTWTAVTIGTGMSFSGGTLSSTITGTVTSVTGTTNRITSSGGATPVIDIAATYVGQTSIITLGTVSTGVWNGTTIAIANGGSGQTTANDALNAFLPTQATHSGKFLQTDGSNTSWASVSGSGTVNGGTIYQLAYYSATGTAVSGLTAITASRALVSDANGLPVASTVTTTQLSYVDATSSIQTQLNARLTAEVDGSVTNELQTYQQVMTTGSTLTGNNTIAGGGFTYAFTNGRFTTPMGATVAAANNLTLGTDGNLFTISGNTTINAITSASWQAGSELRLYFTGTPLLKNNTAGGGGTAKMRLSGNVDYTVAAGDIITFVYDGSEFKESARMLYAVASGTTPLSSITAATASNVISNAAYQQTWDWNSLASGIGLRLLSTSTSASAGSQTILSIEQSGANVSSGQATYAQTIIHTKTGTTSENVGTWYSVSGGASRNDAIEIASGRFYMRNTTEQTRIGYDASNYYTTTVNSTGSPTFNAVGTSPEFTFSDAVNVPDFAYDATSWNGNTEVPTMNAIRDKIESMGSGSGTVTSVAWTTSQGVSASIATATTTPNITITLGALTGVTSFNGLVITANTGVVTTGTWNASIIGKAYGGTAEDNSTGGTANTFWARPNGATGAATYRAIVAADIPTLNQSTTGSAATLTTTRTIWGQNFNGSANVTGDITLSTSSITMTGSIAATGARVTKGWFTDVESTNMYTVGGTSLTTVAQTFQNKTLTSSNNVIGGVTMTLGSDASWDIYVRNASGILERLANGTSGQFLGANTSAKPSWQTPSGGTVTGGADGLSLSGGNIIMGGSAFTANRSITTSIYSLTVPSSNGTTTMAISNSSSGSGSNISSNSGVGANISSTSGIGLTVTTGTGSYSLKTVYTGVATSTPETIAMFTANSSNTPASGYGGLINYNLKSSTTIEQPAAMFGWSWATATHGSTVATIKLGAVYNASMNVMWIATPTSSSGAQQSFLGQIGTGQFALTDAATIAIDFNNGLTQKVTLGGNRTITFSNPVAGNKYLIHLKQDGTGSRTITWPTIKWQGGTTPTLTTTASKSDLIFITYDGTDYFGEYSLNF